MLDVAQREDGADAPITKHLEEEVRAMEATAGLTVYEQFTLGEHELGPEDEES